MTNDDGLDAGGQLQQMAKQMAELQHTINSLQAQIDELRGEAPRSAATPSEPASLTSVEPPAPTGEAAGVLTSPTSRRQLMTKGVAAAAGAALAGTAVGVATASPAAAAQGFFDGDPAVVAVANPTTGEAVRGTSQKGTGVQGRTETGIGVSGESVGFTGDSHGVRGSTFTSAGRGVFGSNLATTGDAEGIRGTTASPNGRGIYGESGPAGGTSYGVVGRNATGTGAGVLGTAPAASGTGVLGKADHSSGVGVRGENTSTDGGEGVRGTAAVTGVYGESTSTDFRTGGAVGVSGRSFGLNGVGVSGRCNGAAGVGVSGLAGSPGGTGLRADGGGVGVHAIGGHIGVYTESEDTQLFLGRGESGPVPPLSATGSRPGGAVVLDTNLDLWLCVATGTPGTWRRISGPATAGAFVPLPAPVRAYDSRPPFPPATGPKTKLTPNQARTVDCTLNGTTVPTTATGVLVSLVATGSAAAGHVAIYRDTIPYPNTSNANFAAGQTVAVTTFSAVTAGKVAVLSNQAIDVVLDILGYYL